MHFSKFLCVFLLLSCVAFADETPVLKRLGKEVGGTMPTIQSVLGYDFGERITSHAQMEKYLNALASAAPDRMKIQKIGETYEGRALYYVLISSAQNMSKLDELRKANLRLADPRKIGASEADAIIDRNPVFTGLSYSVHGAEHSGVEAGLALAYLLLDSKDPEITNILENSVVLIDPMQNPDGRERFIEHFYTNSGTTANPDPNAAEHVQIWPGGRYNHYLFDMNRDWVALTQQETRARVKAYQQYQPQIYMDLHEMGANSTYFFPPPNVPRNPNLPKSLPDWWNKLGKAIATEFDRYNIDYFTTENFDFWYPGYGDSWPTYNGALTGTLEQASVRGLVVKRADGTTMHYKDAIWHHFLSSYAICKMAVANRKDKLRDFYQFRSSAIQEGRTGPVREYIIKRANDPYQADRVAEMLLLHGIEIKQAQADFASTVHGYDSDTAQKQNFQKGDYIISLEQPLKRLIQVIFEKESAFDKSFLEAEEKRKKESEPTELYDITAWSLPLSYGISTYWTNTVTNANATPVAQIARSSSAIEKATYAYLINYNSNQALAAVSQLLQKDVRIYFSQKPFATKNSKFLAGSFIIKIKDNPASLHEMIQKVSQETGIQILPTNSGWTEEGPDLGSNDVDYLQRPRLAVLMHYPTDATSYGAAWYLLDQRYRYSFTPIEAINLGNTNLNDYNVIVMPDASARDYKRILGSDGIEQLKTWVNEGGTLIALQGAASFLIDQSDMTSVKRIKRFVKDSTEPAKEKKADEKDSSDNDVATEAPDFILGSIARAELYRKHFLTYGYDSDEIPVFIASDNVFKAPSGMKAPVSYASADRFKMAGIFWDITIKRLEQKAYATEESVGDGHLILFAEDPNFRGYWEGLNKLFFNGIFFGPSM
jgi:hypothetical protein